MGIRYEVLHSRKDDGIVYQVVKIELPRPAAEYGERWALELHRRPYAIRSLEPGRTHSTNVVESYYGRHRTLYGAKMALDWLTCRYE